MIKRLILFFLAFFLYTQRIVCMDPTSPTIPKTLLKHFGLRSELSDKLKELLVQRIVGPAGWWYSSGELPHERDVHTVLIEKNQAVLADENAVVRSWSLSKQLQIDGPPSAYETPTSAKLCSFAHKNIAKNHSLWCMAFTDNAQVLQNGESYEIGMKDVVHTFFTPDRNQLALVTHSYDQPPNYLLLECISLKVIDYTKLSERIVDIVLPSRSPTGVPVAAAMHPEGKLFALACGDNIYFWNNCWSKVGSIPVKNYFASAVAFNEQGTLFAVGSLNGHVRLYDIQSIQLPEAPCAQDVSRLCTTSGIVDIKFQPKGVLFALACSGGSIKLKDLQCATLMELEQNSIIRELAFDESGSTLIAVGANLSEKFPRRSNAAVVWREHRDLTLEQVLFRCVLKNYIKQCIEERKPIAFGCQNQKQIPLWMADAFMLKKDDLEKVWGSMPVALRQSIFNSLVQRAASHNRLLEWQAENAKISHTMLQKAFYSKHLMNFSNNNLTM